MSAPDPMGRFDLVRQGLSLGLLYHDAATGEPLSAPLRTVIEQAGVRTMALTLMAKPAGAALRFDAEVRRRMSGPANGRLPVRVLVAPLAGLGAARLPDRSVIPRRLQLDLALDAEGLPRAFGPAPDGNWQFRIGLHTGPTFPRAPGVTAVAGRLLRAGAGDPETRALRWAHVVARFGNGGAVVGTARTDDRGEFLLRLRGHPGQPPSFLVPILLRLDLFVPPPPPAGPAPAAPPPPYADVPAEAPGQPDLAIDTPPPGLLPVAGPVVAVTPGQTTVLAAIAVP